MAEWSLPRYSELPVFERTGEPHSQGIFGKDDELGRLNLLTPERVKQAASLVRKGQVFNLTLPLNLPSPALAPGRSNLRHTILAPERNMRDDVLDNFYPQVSSQWDGFRHIRYREFGFYNGFQNEDLEQGRLGVDRWAEHGMVGRGVLADVARYMEQQGQPIDPTEDFPIEPQHVAGTLEAQGVTPQQGDILLLRTGWMKYYLGLGDRERIAFAEASQANQANMPGLRATRNVAEYLWDLGIAAIAADNMGVERFPVKLEEDFLHRRVLPLLGIPLGELWTFEELAEDCAQDGVYAFMLVSVPLRLPNGVGSPANACAIK